MNQKTELQWALVALMISTILVGFTTDFKYTTLSVQIYDTYYVFKPFSTIIYLSLLLWTGKNLFLLVQVMTDRYLVIAFIIIIVNPIVALFIVILLYLNISDGFVFTKILLPVFVLFCILTLQISIQIKMLRKLSKQFNR